MIFRQYELSCLSLYSYLIGDETTGRAVVVDPQRDIGRYLADAAAEGLRIERVIETHFHADFLSGHLELAEATGAVVTYGEKARGKADFPVDYAADGQWYRLGEVELQILSTPGHTPESVCVLVYEQPGGPPYGVLTGDTLFIGDVGRPDLLGGFGLSPADMARDLYTSIHTKLLPLPGETRVFPAHGAGSSCGRAMLDQPSSTIAEQKATNYALQTMTPEEFVDAVVVEQPSVPPYFPYDAVLNRQRHSLLDETVPPDALTVDDILEAQRQGAVVIDTREPAEFAAGHLRESVNVALEGRFAEYAGQVVSPETPLILVGDPGTETEARNRLARIGFDQVKGYLPDALPALVARPELVAQSSRLTASQLEERLGSVPDLQLLDVRGRGEAAAGTIPGFALYPLPELVSRFDELRPDRPTVVVCASGRRSSTAASLLLSRGFADVSDLIGGMTAWSGEGRRLSAAAQPAG
ncbi:MAG TPA: rhodanese-like domain-containing protein [Acidimicrobiales bacterium]|nr:rhodanese-like domain-containing protein [Acidimicrobiales bacterium]